MKPLYLTMQAFGSYSALTKIDFTQTDQNLFLITGDTGAGKTTIFDAMVFALYGEASSGVNKKDGIELQSQYADLATEPFVELAFMEKGDLYTVRRTPRHVRPLKRKGQSQYREEKESVVLTLPDGSVSPQSIREINTKLEEIVGLTKEQFMQVAMIAQGEFMELLRASSNDKKAIFRKLFGTQVYQEIVEELDRRRRKMLIDTDRQRSHIKAEAAHVLLPDAPEEAEEMQAMAQLQSRILQEERISVDTARQFTQGLSVLCRRLEKEQTEAAQTHEEAAHIRDERRDILAGAANREKLYMQLDNAGREIAACREAQPGMDAAAVLAGKITAAYEVKSIWLRLQDAQNVFVQRQQQRDELTRSLPKLTAEAGALTEQESQARRDADQALGVYTKVSEKVRAEQERIRKLAKAQEEERKQAVFCRRAREMEEKAKKEYAAVEEKEKKCREYEEAHRDAEQKMALWQVRAEELRRVADAVKEVQKTDGEIAQLRAAAAKTGKAYEKDRNTYQMRSAAYESARTAYLDAQAGILAGTLKEGMPCPVCGSVHHPNPCRMTQEENVPGREAVDALAREVERLREKQEKSAADAGRDSQRVIERMKVREEKMEAVLNRIRALPPQAGPHAHEALPQTTEKAAEFIDLYDRAHEQAGETLRKEVNGLAQVRKYLEKAAVTKKEYTQYIEKAAEQSLQSRTQIASAQATIKALQAEMQYESKEAAEQDLRTAENAKEQSAAAHRKAQNRLREAVSRMEAAQALLQRCEEELPVLDRTCRERRMEYEEALAGHAITEASWKDVTSSHAKEEAVEIRRQIEAFGARKVSAKKMLAAAGEAIGGQPRPQTDALRKAAEEAQEKLNAAAAALEHCSRQLRADEEALEILSPLTEEYAAQMEAYAMVNSLCSRLAGKVSGARMDLETFVQRYYLERILQAANRRFMEMSAGQFSLRMYSIERAGEGRNRGLDLMVYSAVTGKEREVRTLSGGESFMAALSLALGMADQISETSAAVSPDVMFIDEGFGSLDEHSREQAVRVLQQMAGGSKLIGIISHVTELKNEIEDQLLVTKDDKGSRVRWQIS